MVWVFVFGGIALLGLVMLASYAVWLFHKFSDVMSEVGVLADRGGQLADLVAQVRLPGPGADDLRAAHSGRTVDGEVLPGTADIG